VRRSVVEWRIGARILRAAHSLTPRGASAEFAVVGVDVVGVTAPIPAGMDPGEAAGLPLDLARTVDVLGLAAGADAVTAALAERFGVHLPAPLPRRVTRLARRGRCPSGRRRSDRRRGVA